MPPPSSQQPFDQERPGTLLETDDEIRQALLTNRPGQPAAPPTAPSPKQTHSPPPSSASPYRPTLRPPVALLTVLDDGKGDGEVLRLRADRFIIGRSEGDFLIPHDLLISARHLEITRHRVGDQYRWVLTDLQTTNGLFIRVSRTVLADRAEFLVGKGRYRFEAGGGEQPNTVDYLPSDSQRGSTRPLGDAANEQRPALVELVGDKIISRVPLTKAEYWIGSDPACSIYRPGDPFIEPRHVRLYRDANGAWHAQNNKTSNGLWSRVPQITVEDGCLFQIGEQRFRLKVGGASP
jgi:pSer/pThr/pTyr-binding forkhead associated (FHA) protein